MRSSLKDNSSIQLLLKTAEVERLVCYRASLTPGRVHITALLDSGPQLITNNDSDHKDSGCSRSINVTRLR